MEGLETRTSRETATRDSETKRLTGMPEIRFMKATVTLHSEQFAHTLLARFHTLLANACLLRQPHVFNCSGVVFLLSRMHMHRRRLRRCAARCCIGDT